MTRETAAFMLLIVALAGPAMAAGDDFRQGAAVPMPLTKVPVRLVALDAVGIVGERHVDYDLRLVLRNESRAGVAFTAGLPIGAGVPYSRRENAIAEDLGLVVRDGDRKPVPRFIHGRPSFLAWEATFEPGETREVRVGFRLPVRTFSSAAPDAPAPDRLWLQRLGESTVRRLTFRPVFAARWAGDPESMRIRFRVPTAARARTLEWEEHDPADCVRKGDEIAWTFIGPRAQPIELAWFTSRIPRTEEALGPLVKNLLGDAPTPEDLDDLREIVLATFGRWPESRRMRSHCEAQAWFEPRKSVEIPSSGEALLAAIDRLRETAKPRPSPTLETVVDPGIELPDLDLAMPFPVNEVQRALVVRLNGEKLRPAVWLAGGELVPLRSFDDLGALLKEVADRDREEEIPRASRLNVLVVVDRRTPFDAIVRVLQRTADPSIRVWRTWFAARDVEGRVGWLPVFLPKDRGLAKSGVDPNLVTVDVRLSGEEGESGFTDRDLLYRWGYDLWKRHADKKVTLRVDLAPRLPWEAVATVVNEGRRYGFEVGLVLREVPHRDRALPAPVPSWWMHVGPSVPRVTRPVPRCSPGVVVGGPSLVSLMARHD